MTSLDHLVIRVYSTLARIYIVFHTQEHGDNVKVLKMGQALDGTSSQRDGHRPTEVEFGRVRATRRVPCWSVGGGLKVGGC